MNPILGIGFFTQTREEEFENNVEIGLIINQGIYLNLVKKNNDYFTQIGYLLLTAPTSGASTAFIPFLGIYAKENQDACFVPGISIQPRIMLFKHLGTFLQFDLGIIFHKELTETNIYSQINIGIIL